MRSDYDIEYCQNNGTVAIRPTAHGNLASLVKKTKAEHERVWVFKDYHTWEDEDGDMMIDFIARGVSCGRYRDADTFLAMCRELDLRVESASFFVPFSNGHHRSGEDSDGKQIYTYLETELKLARLDLPTAAQIMEVISPKVVVRRCGTGSH